MRPSGAASDRSDNRVNVRSVARSAQILTGVERHVAQQEIRFGRMRLLDTIEGLRGYGIDRHVETYRSLIRGNEWPNQQRQTTLSQFLNEYERASLAYVSVAFQGFEHLAKPGTRSLSSVYGMVEASEALRGQYGKRSPDGLDARLAAAEMDLRELLLPVVGTDTDLAIETLCTPVEPHVTAEALLLEDFSRLRSFFPSAPSMANVAAASAPATEALWIFLRRHSHWNLERLARWFREFANSSFDDQLAAVRQRRRELSSERHRLAKEIGGFGPTRWRAQISGLTTAITILNHLNLTLEPCFSFKGGVGLSHAAVLTAGTRAGHEIGGIRSDLIDRKWALLETVPQRQTGEATG